MRQARVVTGMGLAVIFVSCTGPISTMRSPYHLRTVEVRNASEEPKVLKIEPTASQHLGAATTFTGVLRPGEVKSLYLYHGFEYDFRVLESSGFNQLTHLEMKVDRDVGLVFAGDSLSPEVVLAATIGEPTTTFADSLQGVDPFGIRSERLQPDTARGRGTPVGARDAIERERQERQGKIQDGDI